MRYKILMVFLVTMLAIFFIIQFLWANPIPGPTLIRINELYFAPWRWELELKFDFSSEYYPINLNQFYLSSKWSTSQFDSIVIQPDETYFKLMSSDLADDFYIDPAGDVLKIIDPNSIFYFEDFPFGIVGNDTLLTPQNEQSLCIWDEWIYYLDNSPTLGSQNDTLNAMGTIQGFLLDSTGNPLDNVSTYWRYNNEYSASEPLEIDVSGHFSFRVLASNITILVRNNAPLPSYWNQYYVTACAESTINLHLIYNKTQSAVETDSKKLAKNYSLSDNYPNPFNSTTFFNYTIPNDGFIKIDIYDISGRLVENLFSGFQGKGDYRLMWDAFNASSGLYFISLKTSKIVLNKKCLLVK